jgi:hypothetical protein
VKFALALVIIVLATRFIHALGGFIAGFPIALSLAWAPGQLRVVVAGAVAGIVSAAAVVAFSYGVFWALSIREAFGLAAVLAAIVPLSLPIAEDFKKARELVRLQTKLPAETQIIASVTTNAARFSVIGDVFGIVLAFLWFFCIYEKNA